MKAIISSRNVLVFSSANKRLAHLYIFKFIAYTDLSHKRAAHLSVVQFCILFVCVFFFIKSKQISRQPSFYRDVVRLSNPGVLAEMGWA